jgi:hypothetical protein
VVCLNSVIVKPRKMRRPRPPRGCRAIEKKSSSSLSSLIRFNSLFEPQSFVSPNQGRKSPRKLNGIWKEVTVIYFIDLLFWNQTGILRKVMNNSNLDWKRVAPEYQSRILPHFCYEIRAGNKFTMHVSWILPFQLT